MYSKSEFRSAVEGFVGSIILEKYDVDHIFSKEESVKVLEKFVTITNKNSIVKLDTFVNNQISNYTYRELKSFIVLKICKGDRNFNRFEFNDILVQQEIARANKESKNFDYNIKAQEKARGILTKEYQDQQRAAEAKKREQEEAAKKEVEASRSTGQKSPETPITKLELEVKTNQFMLDILEEIGATFSDQRKRVEAEGVFMTQFNEAEKALKEGKIDEEKFIENSLQGMEKFLDKETVEILKESFIVDDCLDFDFYIDDNIKTILVEGISKEISEAIKRGIFKIPGKLDEKAIDKEISSVFKNLEKITKSLLDLPDKDLIKKNYNRSTDLFKFHLNATGIKTDTYADVKLLLKKYQQFLDADGAFKNKEEAFKYLLKLIDRKGLKDFLEILKAEKAERATGGEVKPEEKPVVSTPKVGEQHNEESTDEEVEEAETPKVFPKIEVLSPIAPIEGDDVEDPELLEEFNKNYMEGIKFVLPKAIHDATKKYLEEPEKTFDFMKSKTQAIKYLEEMASRYEEAYANSTPERMPSYLIPYLKELDKIFVKLGAELDKNSSKFTNNNLITNEVSRLLKDFIRTKKSKNGYVDVFQDLCLKCQEFNKYLLTDNVK